MVLFKILEWFCILYFEQHIAEMYANITVDHYLLTDIII